VRAIIEDDVEGLRRQVDCGIDIDLRIGPWASELMSKVFQDKCEGAGPFFDCRHPNEKKRPSAVHLAVFFNSFRSLGILVYAGAKRNESCQFMDSKLESGQIVVDKAKTKEYQIMRRIKMGLDPAGHEDSDDDYTPLEVLDHISERNLHRVICGYRRNKIFNWKEICTYSYTRMQAVLQRKVDLVLGRIGFEPPKLAKSAAERDAYRAQAEMDKQTKITLARLDAEEADGETEAATEDMDETMTNDGTEGNKAVENSATTKIEGIVEDKSDVEGSSTDIDVDATTAEAKSANTDRETEANPDTAGLKPELREVKTKISVVSSSNLEGKKEKRRGGFCKDYVPYDGTAEDWHTYGLVQKTEGKPLHLVSSGGHIIQALGKRSYFRESVAHNLDKRHAEEDEKRRRAKFPQKAYRTKPLDRHKFTDINSRVGEIKKLAAKEYSRRSVLRDDLSENDDDD